MKILILKPSSLGDVVQALPVLRLLKLHWPASRIYWWIESGLAPLLAGDPDLAGIVLFERKRWAAPANWVRLARSIAWTRAQQFDLVIDLQALARSAAMGWLAAGKSFIGLDAPREAARGIYDRVVPRPSFHTHAVDWYLGVLPLLGVPADRPFEWLPERREVAAAVRQKWPVNAHRWIGLQPGARWSNKRWPLEYFVQVVQQLAPGHADLRFAILGGLQDRSLGAALTEAAPNRCLDLTGRLSLPEMVEWIRLCELMLTNDTGPMHVAAALGTPVTALFGPTEPRRTGPYGQVQYGMQLDLPCAPCLKSRCHSQRLFECLRGLAPAVVIPALEARLVHETPARASWPPRKLAADSA